MTTLRIGVRVRTLKDAGSTDWTHDIKTGRKEEPDRWWGREGVVRDISDGHGVVCLVKLDGGDRMWYEARELEVIGSEDSR